MDTWNRLTAIRTEGNGTGQKKVKGLANDPQTQTTVW